jgi:hypothetical protein
MAEYDGWGKRKPKFQEREEEGSAEARRLKHKWGFSDPRANEHLESTRRYILTRVNHPQFWQQKLTVAEAEFYKNMITFEAEFKTGQVSDYRDFYDTEPSQDPKDQIRMADGLAYYEAVKPHLDIIFRQNKAMSVVKQVEELIDEREKP